MIVKDLPAIGSLLHHEGEGTAGGGAPGVVKDEPGGYQGKRGAERPDIELLEPETVAGGSRRKSGGVMAPNYLDAFDKVPAGDV